MVGSNMHCEEEHKKNIIQIFYENCMCGSIGGPYSLKCNFAAKNIKGPMWLHKSPNPYVVFGISFI